MHEWMAIAWGKLKPCYYSPILLLVLAIVAILICSYYKPKYFAYSLASKTWLVFRDKHECSQRTMHGVPSETLMDAQCNDTFWKLYGNIFSDRTHTTLCTYRGDNGLSVQQHIWKLIVTCSVIEPLVSADPCRSPVTKTYFVAVNITTSVMEAIPLCVPSEVIMNAQCKN